MMNTVLANVLQFITTHHNGQFDKGGNPYALHPLKVMYHLKTDDIELMCIALLHDVVEDCDVTYGDLRKIGCTSRIIDAVRILTKQPGQTHDEYMSLIKSNHDAIKVKLADLRHNSDIRRLKGVTEKDAARLDKYCKMYNELKDLV